MIVVSVFSTMASGHGTEDHAKTMTKNSRYFEMAQKNFTQLHSREEKIENIEKQMSLLKRKVLLLRNMVATENYETRKAMTKYKIDYLEAIDKSLEKLDHTIEQIQELMEKQ